MLQPAAVSTFRRPRRVAGSGSAAGLGDEPPRQNRNRIHEVADLHGLLRIMAPVLVPDEKHSHWDAGLSKGGRVVRRRTAETFRCDAKRVGCCFEALEYGG